MWFHRRYLYIFMLLGGLLLSPTVLYFSQLRPRLSYWIKHVPLCMAENAGLLSPRRAHYSEKLGSTIDALYCTPVKPPRLVGSPLQHDLIVVSDMGKVVQRISATGHLVWERHLSAPRGLDIHNNKVLVGEGQTLRVLSLATGAVIHAFEFDEPILMARLVRNDLFVLFNVDGEGGVRRYDFSNGIIRLASSSPV